MDNIIILKNEKVDEGKEILVTKFSLNDEELDEMYENYNNMNKNEKKEKIMTRKQFIDKINNKKTNYNNIENYDKIILEDNEIKEYQINSIIEKKLNIEISNDNNNLKINKKNKKNKKEENKIEIIKKPKFNHENFYLNDINKNSNQIKIIIMSNENYYNTILSNYLYGFIKPTNKIIYVNRINKEYEKVKNNMIIKTNNLNIEWWKNKLEDKYYLYFFILKNNENNIIYEKFKNQDNIYFIETNELNEKLIEKNINKMYKKLYEIFKNKIELSKLGAFERIKGMNILYKEILKNKKKYFNEFFHIEY